MKTNQPARRSAAPHLQQRLPSIFFMFGPERITIDIYAIKKRFTCNVEQDTPILTQVSNLLDQLGWEHEVDVYGYQVCILYAGKVYEWNHFAAHKCFHHGSVSEAEFAEMIGFVQPNVGRA